MMGESDLVSHEIDKIVGESFAVFESNIGGRGRPMISIEFVARPCELAALQSYLPKSDSFTFLIFSV